MTTPAGTRAFHLDEATSILERTPGLLRTMLDGLPEHWLTTNEGAGTWAPRDVVGHLVHGERTDWMVRARLILEPGDAKTFEPFDRHGHEQWWEGMTVSAMLDEFERLRSANLDELRALGIADAHLERPGVHPELGPVTLRQLLATWVVHDLHHVGQITRVLAKQYGHETGAWAEYLTILTR